MTDHEEVDRLVAVITIDCYNLAEEPAFRSWGAGWGHGMGA
jgi:hypothetical protein